MSKKISWMIAGCLLCLLLLWAGAKYYATQKMEEFIAQANEGNNELIIKDWQLSLGLLSVGLNADSVTIKQQLGDQLLSGTVANMTMRGFSIRSLLFSEQSNIQVLKINHPRLVLKPIPQDTSRQDTATMEPKRSLPFIANFSIKDGQFTYHTTPDSGQALQVYGLQLTRKDFSLSTTKEGWQAAKVVIDSIHYPTDNNAATWRVNHLAYLPSDSTLTLAKLQLAPHEQAVSFLRRQQYNDDWLAVNFDTIRMYPFQPDSILVEKATLALETLSVQAMSIANYVDPAKPERPNQPTKRMPVESFRRLPFSLDIQQINIEQAQVIYAMLSKDKAPVEVAFTNGQINLRNLRTPTSPDSLYVDATFTFDHAAALKAHFALDQMGRGRSMRMWGTVGAYELPKINPLMITAANAYIEEGQMQSLHYQASVKNELSTGQLLFKYQDLKVDLQNSWLKNMVKGVILKDSNPDKSGTLRYGQIHHEHPNKKSFFNLYWKSILSGLKSTVMADLFNKEELKSVAQKK